MSKRHQRDLFSSTPDTQYNTPQMHGRTSEKARYCASTCAKSQKQRKKQSAKVHFERVHLNVEDVAAWYSVSVPTIWRWHRINSNFPRGHKLTAGSTRWFRTELEAYDRSFQEKTS
jgi:predicted DNA-binding transcriptional regulator AlpA